MQGTMGSKAVVQLAPPAKNSSVIAESPAVWQIQVAWSTMIIALLATMGVVYFARSILFPIVLAILLNFVFKPIVVRADRWRISPPWSSAIILLGILALLGVTLSALWNPAADWISDVPAIRQDLANKLRPLREPVEILNQATKEVEQMASIDNESTPLKVRVEQPGIASFLVNTSGGYLASTVLTMTLLYFLLAAGDRFLEKIVSLMPTWSSKKNAVELIRAIQSNISNYLFTITCINAGFGVIVAGAMWLLGLPTPALWGAVAFALNYIPFVGAGVGACIVFVIALGEFDLAYATIAPLVYILLNLLEGNVVTPSLLGRSMSLNPVVILVSLAIWGWMWGIGGVFVAVPILVAFKIICDHAEPFAPLGKLVEQ